MIKDDDIHLSVVAVSRNDDHGKNLLYRMNQFVNAFIRQANRHKIVSELILVEWNPLQNRKKLAEVLSMPADLGCCRLRFIDFSAELHNSIENSDKIPLFQMIGKNIGIRRAKGSFILATNIDIIFSDGIMEFLKKKLKKGVLYRADRFDVPEMIPDAANLDEMLAFCRKYAFRINTIRGSFKLEKNESSFNEKFSKVYSYLKQIFLNKSRLFLRFLSGSFKLLSKINLEFNLRSVKVLFIKKLNRFFYCYESFTFERLFCYSKRKFYELGRLMLEILMKAMLIKAILFSFFSRFKFFVFKLFSCFKRLVKSGLIKLFSCCLKNSLSNNIHEIVLHTNACGDFTLLSKENWMSMKGYPEWPWFSWHLDSVFMYQAHQHKLRFKNLPPKMAIYHIDHEIGSGYSEEGASLLFKRLNEKGIPYLSNDDLDALRESMLKAQGKVIYNNDDWGFNKVKLPETCFVRNSKFVV